MSHFLFKDTKISKIKSLLWSLIKSDGFNLNICDQAFEHVWSVLHLKVYTEVGITK